MIPPRPEVARRVAAGACIAELETAFRHRATILRQWYPDLLEQARRNGLARRARGGWQRRRDAPVPADERRRQLRAWRAAVADDGHQSAAGTLEVPACWAVPRRDITFTRGR